MKTYVEMTVITSKFNSQLHREKNFPTEAAKMAPIHLSAATPTKSSGRVTDPPQTRRSLTVTPPLANNQHPR